MGAGEKKVAVVLAVGLVVLIGVFVGLQMGLIGKQAPTKLEWASPKAGRATMAQAPAAPGASQAPAASGPGCVTPSGASGKSVPTQEYGKKGAKVEIVAALPITHGCHVNTESELKKAQKAHPNDVHLIIYDLFGPEGQAFMKKQGSFRTAIFINGKTSFMLNGKPVTLEMQENTTYRPEDIGPIVEQQLKTT